MRRKKIIFLLVNFIKNVYQEDQPVPGGEEVIHEPLQVTGEMAEEAGDGWLGLQVDDLQEVLRADERRHAVLGQQAGHQPRLTPLQQLFALALATRGKKRTG
jgi:hypothetical protein